jgi:hypothetical protein
LIEVKTIIVVTVVVYQQVSPQVSSHVAKLSRYMLVRRHSATASEVSIPRPWQMADGIRHYAETLVELVDEAKGEFP